MRSDSEWPDGVDVAEEASDGLVDELFGDIAGFRSFWAQRSAMMRNPRLMAHRPRRFKNWLPPFKFVTKSNFAVLAAAAALSLLLNRYLPTPTAILAAQRADLLSHKQKLEDKRKLVRDSGEKYWQRPVGDVLDPSAGYHQILALEEGLSPIKSDSTPSLEPGSSLPSDPGISKDELLSAYREEEDSLQAAVEINDRGKPGDLMKEATKLFIFPMTMLAGCLFFGQLMKNSRIVADPLAKVKSRSIFLYVVGSAFLWQNVIVTLSFLILPPLFILLNFGSRSLATPDFAEAAKVEQYGIAAGFLVIIGCSAIFRPKAIAMLRTGLGIAPDAAGKAVDPLLHIYKRAQFVAGGVTLVATYLIYAMLPTISPIIEKLKDK